MYTYTCRIYSNIKRDRILKSGFCWSSISNTIITEKNFCSELAWSQSCQKYKKSIIWSPPKHATWSNCWILLDCLSQYYTYSFKQRGILFFVFIILLYVIICFISLPCNLFCLNDVRRIYISIIRTRQKELIVGSNTSHKHSWNKFFFQNCLKK